MNLIPELRFPEFANNGKWDNKPISKLGETVNGLSGKKGADFGSGRPYVQYKQVFDKSFIDFTECGKVDVGENENQNQLQLGDILFTTSSETPDEVGFASVINKQPEEPTYLNSFCFILRPNDLNEINPGFSRYLFHSPIYRKSVSAIAQGSTRYNLSKKAFLKLRVPVPSTPEEQQKIAFCLSSLDELIAAHNDKLDALKDHKKGLLQNLFPQEGETVPKLRFPEFEGDGEWEIKRVEDFFDVGSSKRVLQKDWTNDGVPFYRTRELVSLSKNEPFGSEIFISEDLYIELKESYGVPVEGDFLVSGVGTLGVIYQVKKEDKFYFKDGNVIWFSKREELDSSFFEFCFESSHIQNQIDAQTSKSTVGTYTIKNARITEFWHPPRIEEQQKIASCLSAVDELIMAQQEKIEQLQQHKKGLMQGLFPKMTD